MCKVSWAAAVLILGAFVASAAGEWRTVEVTFTPEFVNIDGTDYPKGDYEGFNGHLPPIAPQFSKIVATLSINFDGETQPAHWGSSFRLYDVHDPSNVIFTTSYPGDLYRYIVFWPAGQSGDDTPWAKLEMVFRGPDTQGARAISRRPSSSPNRSRAMARPSCPTRGCCRTSTMGPTEPTGRTTISPASRPSWSPSPRPR